MGQREIARRVVKTLRRRLRVGLWAWERGLDGPSVFRGWRESPDRVTGFCISKGTLARSVFLLSFLLHATFVVRNLLFFALRLLPVHTVRRTVHRTVSVRVYRPRSALYRCRRPSSTVPLSLGASPTSALTVYEIMTRDLARDNEEAYAGFQGLAGQSNKLATDI